MKSSSNGPEACQNNRVAIAAVFFRSQFSILLAAGYLLCCSRHRNPALEILRASLCADYSNRLLIGILLWLASVNLHALDNADLVSFDATYQVSIKDISQGETRVELKLPDEGSYLYRSHTQPTLIASWFRDETVNEESRFRITDNRLVPLSYEYRRVQNEKTRLITLNFDWDNNKVVNSVAGDSWAMPIPLGALDKVLVNLALMLDLQRGKPSIEYPVADGGILKTYRFEITGRESIETPAGTFETVLVKRSREDKQPTYFWCAPQLAFLPVRIERRLRHDMRFTSELKAFSGSLRGWKVRRGK